LRGLYFVVMDRAHVYGVHAVPGLKRIREGLFISQTTLSADAGVNVANISRLENGSQQARLATIRKLAKALGCKPAALLEG